ncbi:positive regulator of sigma(E), RseC/MucC [Sulfurivirga caldicuralii]|uniref:Positive regulator of sigma(E), RseC/MucC n=1 Tax=Sulfurivirga caldicuralii TaxID=364032 RepID=A0A1N6F4D0_9GAMM|nr:SoxR reducing system RseC family protein [Sulfurivirga caldicuralii]SIN90133.1 positive regulator of sigma(E), RseC/MucC [Sulfurivirga caldicuralii]
MDAIDAAMQTSIGRVVRADAQWVWVETQRESGCSSCAAKGVCGSSVLETLFSNRHVPIRLPNTHNAQTGDMVELALPESALLRQSLWAYGVPLLGFIVGAMAGQALDAELGAIVGSMLGLAGGFGLTRRFAAIQKPHIMKVYKGVRL